MVQHAPRPQVSINIRYIASGPLQIRSHEPPLFEHMYTWVYRHCNNYVESWKTFMAKMSMMSDVSRSLIGSNAFNLCTISNMTSRSSTIQRNFFVFYCLYAAPSSTVITLRVHSKVNFRKHIIITTMINSF